MLKITGEQARIRPLDSVSVKGAEGGAVAVRDGAGREYVRAAARGGEVMFRASGALGTHLVSHEDNSRRVVETATFTVECKTELRDEGGRFKELLDLLYWSMVGLHGEAGAFRTGGKFYRFFVGWLRDHVHTLKGMKYFYPDLKSAIELYADTQREDGMIWDNVDKDFSPAPTHRDHIFGPLGFITTADEGRRRMERIPVENDVEYLFIEGIYYTWKATGDDLWMAALLDNAIKAYEYSTTDPYRWSEKYGLLKRGFTIDTWDFQSEEDTRTSGHAMVVFKDRTRFGVMHGDNTGFIAGCHYLAEMLDAAGRHEEAEKHRRLGADTKQRLDDVSWNGEFYTHHVPEDPEVERDLGVDQAKQVSLSNAYALNRGLTHEQCVAIIRTYQRIREEMPATSPGEFYQIYPPFERGFGGHNRKWHYMNGGVTSIVAGELAHGAFEHGFERYGVDILERMLALGKAHDDYLHCTYRGAMPEPPERSFTPVDLTGTANVDISGEGAEGVPGWTGEGENDLSRMPTGRQVFHDVPFDVIEPADNGRRACIAISSREGYAREVTLAIGDKVASLYFLHTCAGSRLVGSLTIHYADGESHVEYIYSGVQLAGWWMPRDPRHARGSAYAARVAWRGTNAVFPNVGNYVWGLDNPRPDVEISDITFAAPENGNFWVVLGVTLCDAPVFFMPDDLSFGIPDNWGAAAVAYALIEGLAGAKDTGVAYDRALVAPRWPAAGVDKAAATIKYEASGGYVSYDYAVEESKLRLDLAGNAEAKRLELLLPDGAEPTRATVDGREAEFTVKTVESSRYVCMDLSGIAACTVEVTLET